MIVEKYRLSMKTLVKREGTSQTLTSCSLKCSDCFVYFHTVTSYILVNLPKYMIFLKRFTI